MSEAVPTRLPAIQGLRALAALMVLAAHVLIVVQIELYGIAIPDLPLSPFPLVAGVDVFFVISGFVMALASRNSFGRPGARRLFVWRRLARIVPLYWLVTLALVLLIALRHGAVWEGWSAGQIAASFLFVPVPNPDGLILPVVDLGWTLNYEMFFYAIFALALGWRRPVALALLVMALVGLPLAQGVFRWSSPLLTFWGSTIVWEFMGGIAIEAVYRRGLRLPAWSRWLLLACAIVLLFLMPGADYEWRWLRWGGPAMLIVLAAVSGPTPFGRMTGWVEGAGDLSYAIYLTHFFAIRLAVQVADALALPASVASGVGFLLIVIGVTVAVSAVLHVGFERPLLRLARRAEVPLFGSRPLAQS